MKKIIVTVEDDAVSKLCSFLNIIDGVDEFSEPMSVLDATGIKQIEINVTSDSDITNVCSVPKDIELVFINPDDGLIAIYGEGNNNIIEQKI